MKELKSTLRKTEETKKKILDIRYGRIFSTTMIYVFRLNITEKPLGNFESFLCQKENQLQYSYKANGFMRQPLSWTSV